MVKRAAALPALIALTALLGAVGIGPRRDTGAASADEESKPARPAASTPAPRAGIAPRPPAIAPSGSGPVTIRPRAGDGGPARTFSHHFDGRVHWYGYPFGASYYWLRPYGGFWWMWDAGYSRWVYWHDGFWWWPGPGGAHFVYLDNAYYPYEAVRRAGYAAPSAAPAGAPNVWTSPDGRRLIEVGGPENQAVLYDKTADPPAYLRLLGKNARKARFAAAAPGLPPTITLEFADGGLALFDYDGRRLDAAKPGAAAKPPPAGETPPAPPAGLPPPPDDLPPPN